MVDLIRKDADRDRDGDVLGAKEVSLLVYCIPIEMSRGNAVFVSHEMSDCRGFRQASLPGWRSSSGGEPRRPPPPRAEMMANIILTPGANQSQKTALLAFLFLGLVWGSNFIFMKWAAQLISPAQIVLLRAVFGFLPVFIYALAQGTLRWQHVR